MSLDNIFTDEYIARMSEASSSPRKEVELLTIVSKEFAGKVEKKTLKNFLVEEKKLYLASGFSHTINKLIKDKVLFEINNIIFCNPIYVKIDIKGKEILKSLNELV
jgi:hypothetical protein